MTTRCSEKEQGLSEEAVFKLKDDHGGVFQAPGTAQSTLR